MRQFILSLSLLFCSIAAFSQKTENVILITLDGLRWQEVFTGADSLLIDDSGYVENPEELVRQYWHEDPTRRRALLMPFFWSTISNEGQLYGNRLYGNKVNCSNHMWFSYPGYSEILCGYADDERINSNDKVPNPNQTVLEFLNNSKEYHGDVAAFGSWDVFPFIVNEERSGIPVNAGFETCENNPNEIEGFLNKIQEEIRGPWGSVRLDVFTHHYAMETLKKEKPRVLYIAYGETDDFAHDGEYDEYLKSAHQTDAYIKELWDFVQSDEQYLNKTTWIITTDHGRGTDPKKKWKDHGPEVHNAGEIWMAILGPDTPALGELKKEGQLYQNQVASTLAESLGVKYKEKKAGRSVAGALRK